jgi:hypothetical protein
MLELFPEIKWPKIELLREFTGKNVAIRCGHFGNPT